MERGMARSACPRCQDRGTLARCSELLFWYSLLRSRLLNIKTCLRRGSVASAPVTACTGLRCCYVSQVSRVQPDRWRAQWHPALACSVNNLRAKVLRADIAITERESRLPQSWVYVGKNANTSRRTVGWSR